MLPNNASLALEILLATSVITPTLLTSKQKVTKILIKLLIAYLLKFLT